jgi:hypothetical protein
MTWFDRIILLLTGLTAVYLIWRLRERYIQKKGVYDLLYMAGFAVLFVSGVLLIFLGYGILGLGGSALSPYILPIASLIPLCISVGISRQYYPNYGKYYMWFAIVGLLVITVSSIGGMATIKKISVPVFHSIAGLTIFLSPILASSSGKSAKGFLWVGIGGALIGIGGIALAFLTSGAQLLFFSTEVVLSILAPILLLMALAFAWGFMKDLKEEKE